MTAALPQGAQPIVDARMRGQKPADMVIIALGGPQASLNPVVYAKASERYDWRWLRGLDVCLYVSNEDDWPGILTGIAKARPRYLGLWNQIDQWGCDVLLIPTLDDIGKPLWMWRFELDFLPWMDFQNTDFAQQRRYGRDEHGMPYAIDKR